MDCLCLPLGIRERNSIQMKSGTTIATKPGRAAIHATESSRDQEREGCLFPAQIKLLKENATHNSLRIAMEYVDVETAKQAGRVASGEMTKLRANLEVHSDAMRKPYPRIQKGCSFRQSGPLANEAFRAEMLVP